MKILKKDLKQGFVKVQITNNEDLWYLSHIIDEKDLVSGSSERKIKIGEEPNIKTVRKRVYLEIEIEKTEYEPENHSLRLLGQIRKGPEDVSLGSYHSFNLSVNDDITITKNWLKYQVDKLYESQKESKQILVVIFDREKALFSELKKTGHKLVSEMRGGTSKKSEEYKDNEFYKEISKKIEEINHKYDKIIIASPAFFKEYLMKQLNSDLTKKIIQANVNSVDSTSIKEILKSENLNKSLQDFNASLEEKIVEEVMTEIQRDNACYGVSDVEEKISIGNVKKLVVSETYLKKMKEEGKYEKIDSLLKTADKMGADIKIISDESAVKKVDGLGGIAGVCRWKS